MSILFGFVHHELKHRVTVKDNFKNTEVYNNIIILT